MTATGAATAGAVACNARHAGVHLRDDGQPDHARAAPARAGSTSTARARSTSPRRRDDGERDCAPGRRHDPPVSRSTANSCRRGGSERASPFLFFGSGSFDRVLGCSSSRPRYDSSPECPPHAEPASRCFCSPCSVSGPPPPRRSSTTSSCRTSATSARATSTRPGTARRSTRASTGRSGACRWRSAA